MDTRNLKVECDTLEELGMIREGFEQFQIEEDMRAANDFSSAAGHALEGIVAAKMLYGFLQWLAKQCSFRLAFKDGKPELEFKFDPEKEDQKKVIVDAAIRGAIFSVRIEPVEKKELPEKTP